jgi:CcmD family protein
MNLLIFLLNLIFAEIPMADQMRAEGKIYVVVAVMLLIMTGIFMYLFYLDKKVQQLEEEIQSKNNSLR